jgi:hypothetical protein
MVAFRRLRAEGFLTRPFTISAGLSTRAAVLVMCRVPLALLRAHSTCQRASLKQTRQYTKIVTCPPGRDACRRRADISTIEIQVNAVSQRIAELLYKES